MFYTLSSRLLVPPNTIFVTDHTTGYFVNVLRDWLIVILSSECYIVICIDWLYVYFTALCFSHVEVSFDISAIKELIDWLTSTVDKVHIICSICLPPAETHTIRRLQNSLKVHDPHASIHSTLSSHSWPHTFNSCAILCNFVFLCKLHNFSLFL